MGRAAGYGGGNRAGKIDLTMRLRNLLAALLFVCAGLSNGVMDSLQFHYPATVFSNVQRFDPQFWNPAESWKNKYKNRDVKQGEAFKGSSTVFVFVTDGWHLVKFLMLKFLFLGVVAFRSFSRRDGSSFVQAGALNATAFIVLHLCFQLGFKLAYV